jgi:hypothetical protein
MKVCVIDNFLADPMAEREKALAASYVPVNHNGIDYRGIALTEDVENRERIAKTLGIEANGDWTTFWRRNLEGEASETYIHSDAMIGDYSAILYLSLPEHCRGGTAFWRHKLYGWYMQPTLEEVEALGLDDTPALWDSVYQDGFIEKKWEMVDYVPMAFNRLIIFHSKRFHSRYPKESFGGAVSDGRLIKVFFKK